MIHYSSEDLLTEVQRRIKHKTPSSIVRYGDGEAIVLNGFKDMASLKMVMKRQLDFVPPVGHIEEIRGNLIEAYKDADIIGIPIRERLGLSDYWHKAFGILNESVGIEVLTEKKFTDIDFHSEWLERGYFDRILKGVKSLCYVSCRDLTEGFKRRYGIKNVYSFQVAPEMKFTSGYEGEPHYPDQFKKVKRWIEKIPVEGSICLVGAGVIGKRYCTYFKERGGIALDIGSVCDQWAGLQTRGRERGLDRTNDKFKL